MENFKFSVDDIINLIIGSKDDGEETHLPQMEQVKLATLRHIMRLKRSYIEN